MFIPTAVCHNNLFVKGCNCKEEVRKRVMASKAKIKEHLNELGVEYNNRNGAIKLANLFVDTVKKIGHADDFSPELRRTLINDYYFVIKNEKGEVLDEFLEVKTK
jgi:predicted membrane GTPase involved in stress response